MNELSCRAVDNEENNRIRASRWQAEVPKAQLERITLEDLTRGKMIPGGLGSQSTLPALGVCSPYSSFPRLSLMLARKMPALQSGARTTRPLECRETSSSTYCFRNLGNIHIGDSGVSGLKSGNQRLISGKFWRTLLCSSSKGTLL